MVAPVAKKSSPIILTNHEPKTQQAALITSQSPPGLNALNGLGNRAQLANVPSGKPATDGVIPQPKNNALVQFINPFTQCINVRAMAMFNQSKQAAAASQPPGTGQQARAAKPTHAHSARQKIMATLAREAEQQINKSHLRKLDTGKRLTRQAISGPIMGRPPTQHTATALVTNTISREALTKAKTLVDSAVTEFGIVEKGMADSHYASQAIDSALCAIYSNHKDNFLKRLEHSAKPVQSQLLNTLPADAQQEIRQAHSHAQTSQPQQAQTKVTGALDKLEKIKDKPMVKAFGMSHIVTLLQKGIVKMAGRSLLRNSLQDTVATAYQKGCNVSLATGSLQALDAVTQKITQHQRGSADARANNMPYPHTELEIVSHEAVLNHLLKTKGHARHDGNVLSAAAQIAYHKGLCDGIRNAYLHTIGSAAQDAGLSGNAPQRDKAFTPTGAGANPYIRPMLDAVTRHYPDALMNPEIKDQLSKHAHNRLMAEIETLSKHLKPKLESFPSSDRDNDSALKVKLQNLVKYSPDNFDDSLVKISERFEGGIAY
ncbi:hypothetical protein [Candidatus Symbiopectobacterium sp. NZEC135]|uniref:hypothetical protein n=1 Tax=Candidatus Symbiopectobacterium sp. NZEC135 TaxID=2820471 RepID=UPI0022273BE6|nr:hypothetical protein [Candidatus Symbiopectobacterium sp. NZEC135]MCW2477878.1 hypothetical protein [Candidatus Symbiopectobacterium sp. NZEC135]